VAAWGSIVVLFINAASVLDNGDLELDGSTAFPTAKLDDVPARCNIDVFDCFFTFPGDDFGTGFVPMNGFAGVLVGDNDTGSAKAADRFLFCGVALGITFRMFEGGAFEVEFGFGVEELGICGKAFSLEGWFETTAGSRASLSKGSGCDSNAIFGPAFEGNRSRLEAGNLRSAGGRIGVRMSGLRGLGADFLSGDTLSVETFDPVNQGAFGVFEISICAALA
jgi:hypothetical protein